MAATAPNAQQPLALLDLQFDPDYSQYKANQLAEAMRTAENAVNTLQSLLSDLTTQVNDNPGLGKHVLATESGLGPDHSVSGLVAGQALVATGATSAEFAAIQLSQLADMDTNTFADPQDGQVLGVTDGFFGLIDVPGADTNQTFVTLNNEAPTLPNSKQLVAGANVSITTTSNQVQISATGGTSGISEIDGGDAISTYLITQDLNGGNSNPNGFIGPPIDGGDA